MKKATKTRTKNKRLTYQQRKGLPDSAFGLPELRDGGKGGYPLTDAAGKPSHSHAVDALARASAAIKKHEISEAQHKRLISKIKRMFPNIRLSQNPNDPVLRSERRKLHSRILDAEGMIETGKKRREKAQREMDDIEREIGKNPRSGNPRTLDQVKAAQSRAVSFLRDVAKKPAEAKRFAAMTPQQYAKHKGWIIGANNGSRAVGKRRGNPDDAAAMYETFHGRAASGSEDYAIPQEIPHEVAELGRLVKIVLVGGAELVFENPDAGGSKSKVKLCANAEGTQMYCVGEAGIDRGWLERNCDISKELLDLGIARQVEYMTEKRFDSFQPTVYFHRLGEEGGEKPRVLYNQRTKQIYWAGGDYTISAPGIEN